MTQYTPISKFAVKLKNFAEMKHPNAVLPHYRTAVFLYSSTVPQYHSLQKVAVKMGKVDDSEAEQTC